MLELLQFIGVVLYMGVVKVGGERQDYWGNCPIRGQEYVHALMKRRRFEEILSNLHWVDKMICDNV